MSSYSNYSAQMAAVSGRMQRPRVRIVADSATDLLPSYAQVLGILVVPNRIVWDGQVWLDGRDITPAQFFARLAQAKTLPYTEPATVEDFYYAYQTAFQQGATEIISIHVSGKLSQVVANARTARDHVAPTAIHVIDSLQAGIGLWPALTESAKLASQGAPVQDVWQIAVSTLARTRVFVLVESLEYLRRSGRVKRFQEMLGTMLDAHPILTLKGGEVVPVETVRPRSRAMARLRDISLAQGPIAHLLLCGSSITMMSDLESLFQRHYDGALQKTWLGPTLGANTGPAAAVAVTVR
jgi:DegV family protein with EDD domain